MNIKFKNLMIFVSILLLQPMMNSGSQALAKKKGPMKAYSFIAEGGKASQEECDGTRKLPRLRRLKEFTKANAYVGSELQTSELPGKPNQEMWAHYFRNKPACAAVLAKTPSSVVDPTAKDTKREIPSEDDADDPESPHGNEGAADTE